MFIQLNFGKKAKQDTKFIFETPIRKLAIYIDQLLSILLRSIAVAFQEKIEDRNFHYLPLDLDLLMDCGSTQHDWYWEDCLRRVTCFRTNGAESCLTSAIVS